MFEGYIRRVTQKWRESRGSHELIGGLIVNLAFCKMSLRSEIDKRQNINLNSGLDDDVNPGGSKNILSRIQLNLKCINCGSGVDRQSVEKYERFV
jgi:hypothetical protein